MHKRNCGGMAAEELVIDTNVFEHAGNLENKFYESAYAVMQTLHTSDVILCFDDEGLIAQEYWTRLEFQPIGRAALSFVGSRSRYRQVPVTTSSSDVSWMISIGVSKPRDRTFIGVGANTADKILISNDEADFKPSNRRKIQRKFDMKLLFSNEYASTTE